VTNTDPAPAPGATQPIGGFSALLDAGNGDFYAMPDNGFGSKANSRSFILRLPHQTIEAILPIGRDEIAVVNDTNFGSMGRTRPCRNTATSSS
jgi:hypothetical protein